jgi:hypothetical protein
MNWESHAENARQEGFRFVMDEPSMPETPTGHNHMVPTHHNHSFVGPNITEVNLPKLIPMAVTSLLIAGRTRAEDNAQINPIIL